MAGRKALIIGVSDYPVAPLATAAMDAQDMKTLLDLPNFAFDTTLLLNYECERKRAQAALGDLIRSDAEVALFYFAGHAIQTPSGPYLVTSDGDADDPGISLDFIRRLVVSQPSPRRAGEKRQFVIVLDCCHAGAFRLADSEPLNPEVLRSVAQSSRNHVALIGACGPLGLASEVIGSNSPFTRALIDGALGAAADSEGKVRIPRLFDYVATRLENTEYPEPVLQADIVGSLSIGEGLEANTPDAGSKEAMIRGVEEKGEKLMEDYFARTSTTYSERNTGFQEACRTLEPLLRWFEHKQLANPELENSRRFRDAFGTARARLGHLGMLSPGTVLPQGWILSERIGAGTFGTVWKCTSEKANEVLAYKAYNVYELDIAEKRRLFRRGWELMRLLDHPRIVKVADYTGCPIGFFMDFIDGSDLRRFDLLSRTDKDPIELMRYLIELVETIQYAHGYGVYHRDIKPENIIMRYDVETGRDLPVLTDFDLAWFSSDSFRTESAYGAFYYAAPEQRRAPRSEAAHRPTTDVYAFAQLCYYVLCRQDPVLDANGNAELLKERLNEWPTEAAANAMLETYVQCSKQRPEERIPDFRTISSRLYGVQEELLRVRNGAEALDVERFLRELRFSLIGLAADDDAEGDSFSSVSLRTYISLEGVARGPKQINVEVRLQRQEPFFFPGLNFEEARNKVNGYIDDVIRNYPSARRRAGRQGIFESYIDVRSMPKTLSGVRDCREVISRIIDVIERS